MLVTETTNPKIDVDVADIKLPCAEVSDLSLIGKVKQGNINAYGGIMRRYNQRMYRVARSIVKNDADALDIVQEAHIKAYTKIKSFRGNSQLSTWLAAITRNEALMHLRKSKREKFMSENETDGLDITKSLEKPFWSPPNPESCLENKELKTLINDNVDLLPVDFRSVFVLRTIEQLSVKETAAILGINSETVKTRLFRAKRLLRAQIQVTLERADLRVYEVGGVHCDAIVQNVLARIRKNDIHHDPSSQ